MGSRPKVIFFVSMIPGNVECKTCCLKYVTLVNSLSSASSTVDALVYIRDNRIGFFYGLSPPRPY